MTNTNPLCADCREPIPGAYVQCSECLGCRHPQCRRLCVAAECGPWLDPEFEARPIQFIIPAVCATCDAELPHTGVALMLTDHYGKPKAFFCGLHCERQQYASADTQRVRLNRSCGYVGPGRASRYGGNGLWEEQCPFCLAWAPARTLDPDSCYNLDPHNQPARPPVAV